MTEFDDLDILLDELHGERPLCGTINNNVNNVKAPELEKNQADPSGDTLDDLIGEMLSDDHTYDRAILQKTQNRIPETYSKPIQLPAKEKCVFSGKCEPPWILKDGQACTNLRCMKCDFAIVHFEGSAWTDAADYLFFRNFHPNRDKLKSRLLTKNNHLASCCQCKWRTIECENYGPIPIPGGEVGDGLWTCFGH